jgi:alpha-1,3-rhamnosyl/mannosyltransferase
VRELLRSLAERGDPHRYVLYARKPWEELSSDERFSWRLIPAGEPWWHVLAARAANRDCDVYLASNSYLTTWFLRVPTVPIVYDMVAFDRAQRPSRRSAIIERATLGPAVRRSTSFIAISHATANAFERRFPRARGRVTVAHLGASLPGAGTAAAGELADLPGPGFVLAVGTLEPRKNLPRLVAAFALLPDELQRRHPLVAVGATGWQTGETLAALDGLGERAVRLGYVSDSALAELYRRCALFAYPSLGEGFGLPVLEAMAAGAAVLTSDLSSLPEVGGDAVEYVDPFDVAAIARKLDELLRSPDRRTELGRVALARAATFSWSRTAETVLRALDAAAASPRASAGGSI